VYDDGRRKRTLDEQRAYDADRERDAEEAQ